MTRERHPVARPHGAACKYGAIDLAMPVTYYSQLMTVAYGGTAKEAGLDGHRIAPTKLQQIAAKSAK
jgi:heterodisulfide reductase subunit B